MSPAPPRRRTPSLRGTRCTGTLADKTIFACATSPSPSCPPGKCSRQRLADSRRLVPQKRPQRGKAEAIELSGLRDDANDSKGAANWFKAAECPGQSRRFDAGPATGPNSPERRFQRPAGRVLLASEGFDVVFSHRKERFRNQILADR